MESKFLIYTKPQDVTGEPVGSVMAEDARDARHKAAKVIQIGYEIFLVQEGFGPAQPHGMGWWVGES